LALSGDVLNRITTDDLAHQISASWAIFDSASFDLVFQQMAAQGQSFFQASGDDGAFNWITTQFQQHTDNAYVTLVGGTTLFTTGPLGAWQSETVWNWNSTIGVDAASGGGISPNYLIPPWQQGINMSTNGGSTTYRNIPDVALTADNVWVIADQGQGFSVGGTSAAAPLWAAFTALANEQAANLGQPPLGFMNPPIYLIGKGPLYNQCFHDITTGNNTNVLSPNQFYAVPGYDLCTGWGTPTGSNLINALVPPVALPILAVFTNILSGGNGNGVVDFNECNNLTVVITNEGKAIATHVQGILISDSFPAVTVGQGVVSFPDIPPRSSVIADGVFTINTQPSFVCGTPVNLTLVVKCDQVVQTNQFQLPSGILAPPIGFTNNTAIAIPSQNFNAGTNSPITVSGITSVGKITVACYISTLIDEALTIQLVSPAGQTVTLVSETGFGENFGAACAPESSETVFDDRAMTPISLGAPPYVGSFAPQNPLSSFNLLTGTNVNGTWNLVVLDEFADNLPEELNCWSLYISPYLCQDGGGQCPGAALGITMTASPNPVLESSNLVYVLTVTNGGPSSAEGVVVNQTLDPTVGFVAATNISQGNVTAAGGSLGWDVGTLPVGSNATASIVTIPVVPKLVLSTATVGFPGQDLNPNNTASASVLVIVPSVEVAVTMIGSPNPVPVGGLLTYAITVTNNGPFTAYSVTLTNTLPPNVNVVSVATSQGTYGPLGAVVDLGTLAPGTNATVDLVVSPTTTGVITATTQVSIAPSETDPVSAATIASATNTVVPAADLAVSALSTPNPVISGSNFTYVLAFTNHGPNDATAVSASQTLPASVGFVSSSFPLATNANGVLTWNIGNLASGGALTITNVVSAPTLIAGVSSLTLLSPVTIFGQPTDPNTNNNAAIVRTVVEPPTVAITLAGVTLASESFQPPDGAVDPGETVGVEFFLQNTGTITTTNLVATLQASGGVTLPSGPQSYGALQPGSPAVERQFSFTANGTNGGTVVATLQLQDGSTNLGTVSYSFAMPVVTTFWNTNFISIPAPQFIPAPDLGPGNPYPSTLAVSGISNFVENVTVTVSNLSHTYPHDIDMLLVGPGGQNSVLMSEAAAYSSVSNATITFDQTAALIVPPQGQIVSGSYQPADYNPTNSLPSNAPAGPYSANLALFAGLSSNNIWGTWSLYVFDNAAGDAGGIANGWGLTITTITPVNQIADLAATVAASASQVLLGATLTNTVTVVNHGPNAAASVVLTNVLSSGLNFVSTSLAQSSYVQSGQTTIFNLGALAAGSNLTFTIITTAAAAGTQSSSVSVGSTQLDPNPGNNSASAVTVVTSPIADVAAAISATNAVTVGSNLVYTLTVTNNGPNIALNVTGSFEIGNGMQLISATPSQGVVILNAINTSNGMVQCNFGNIVAGNIATLTITNIASQTGLVTNSWTVSTDSTDTNLANNSVTLVVSVSAPQPLIVAAGASLASQNQTPSGTINPNQAVTLAFTLANIGLASTTNLVAVLQSSGGVTPGAVSNQTYGAIAPGSSMTENFTFTAHGNPGAVIAATLVLVDGPKSLGSVTYTFILPLTSTFTNSAAIVIPDYGPGSPYPAPIAISGLTGVVSKVTATLQGFTHSYPHDVNIMLINPTGQKLILLAHVGGPYSVTNLTLTFDDSATNPLPATMLSSGVFLPTQYAPTDVFPGLSGTPDGTTLSVFNGMIPLGTWSLYVFDDTQGNAGNIANGWTLGLTTVNPVNPPARLGVSMIHAPDPVYTGGYLTYQIVITNLGPSTASNVVLSDVLPAAEAFVSGTVSQGVLANVDGTVTASLGAINASATAVVTLEVQALQAGAIVNTVSTTTTSTDLYPPGTIASDTATVLTELPAILSAQVVGGGGLQVTLAGQAGQSYAIQESTDLVSWVSVLTNASPNGTITFTDSRTNAPMRFYRAVRISQ
jgi:uncharacterized repeat protein (TIGR01451 family)